MRSRILSISRTSIPYVKDLRGIAGSVTGCILMQQLDYWFERKPQGFYKFMRPSPKSPGYSAGDSWAEELGFSVDEFRSAFDRIGVRYKTKTHYREANARGEAFTQSGIELFYCSYYDKQKNTTFYFRNHPRLDAELDSLCRVPGDGNPNLPEMEIPISGDGKSQSPRDGKSQSPLYTEITNRDHGKRTPIVPQGGLDTAPSALALGGEANQPASPQPADSTPVEVVASSVKGRGSARRDRIAEVFELGRTALDVRRFHGQYRMLCNMVGAAPGALSKAQQAAASCWDRGEVPQGFEAGLAAFIWVKAAEAGAGHSCLAIPTFANFIENPHYGEDAIARQVMLQQHPELANPKTAKKAFEQHQVERAMSDWVNQPCEPDVAPSGPQPMSEAEEQRRHQQRIANLDLSAIPAPPSPWSKP
jgi:hypothetical protein